MTAGRPILVTLLLVVAPLLIVAASPPQDMTLDDLMGAMKSNLKTAAQTAKDEATRPRALEAVREMQVITLAARSHMPHKIEDMDAAARPAEMVAYQIEMARLLVKLAELEIDLLKGDVEGAYAAINGPLYALRDKAHDRWQ